MGVSLRKRSPERIEFLTNILTTAVENYGYGWFSVKSYHWDVPDGGAYAVIREDETGKVFRVDLDVIAKGLGVIRRARVRFIGGEYVPHNAETGERLEFGGEARRALLLADRTNGEDGDYDVVGALAVVECALFGHVVYG